MALSVSETFTAGTLDARLSGSNESVSYKDLNRQAGFKMSGLVPFENFKSVV